MERWQKALIRKNLPALIEQTSCNVLFLASLQSQGVIHPTDMDLLNVTRFTLGNLEQTKKLYDILQTRSNAFEILLTVLRETCQTGAYGILQEGILAYDKSKIRPTQSDSPIEQIYKNEGFPLHKAAELGDVEAVQHFLELKVYGINEPEKERNWTPIQAAIDKTVYNFPEIIKLLVENDADLNPPEKDGKPLLWLLFYRQDKPVGWLEAFHILIGKLQTYDVVLTNSNTSIKELLRFNGEGELNGQFVLLECPWKGVTPKEFHDVLENLASAGAKELLIEFHGDDDSCVLDNGMKYIDVLKETMELLKGLGFDLHRQREVGRTAVHQAIYGGRGLNCVRNLVETGAELTITNGFDGSALHVACRFNRIDLIPYLISNGADVNGKMGTANFTPLDNVLLNVEKHSPDKVHGLVVALLDGNARVTSFNILDAKLKAETKRVNTETVNLLRKTKRGREACIII